MSQKPQPRIEESDLDVLIDVEGIIQEIFPDAKDIQESTNLVEDLGATIGDLLLLREKILEKYDFYIFSETRLKRWVEEKKPPIIVKVIIKLVEEGKKNPEKYQRI